MPVSRSPFQQILGASILLVVAGILFIPAYLLWNASIQHSAESLPRCGQAPAFQEKDQAGRPIGISDLRGRVWLVDFVNVADRDQGELLTSEFAELDQNSQRSGELALISFSIGAGSGTGVQEYAKRHEASSRWHFLATGESITPIVKQWSAATTACRGTLPLEKTVVLVDQDNEIRGVYDASAPEVVQKMLIDVGGLLRAGQSPGSAP
jgi:hypothetical protein